MIDKRRGYLCDEKALANGFSTLAFPDLDNFYATAGHLRAVKMPLGRLVHLLMHKG